MPVQWLSCILLFVTPWTVACQAPLSVVFFRQEYWGGLPFPPAGDLPYPGIKPTSPALAGRFFTTSATWEAYLVCVYLYIFNTDTFWGRGACCTCCRILVPWPGSVPRPHTLGAWSLNNWITREVLYSVFFSFKKEKNIEFSFSSSSVSRECIMGWWYF